MSQRSTPAILVVTSIVALGLIGVWFLFQTDGAGDTTPVTGPGPADAATAASPEPAEVVEVSPATEELSPAPSASGGVRTALQPRAPEDVPEDAIWIEGTVRRAPDTPADEQMLVLALSTEVTPRGVYMGSIPDWAWESARTGEPARESEYFAGHAPVDASGAFRLAVSAEIPQVWLVLSGHYSFSGVATEVEVREDAPAPELIAELGAWVTGQVRAPEGVVSDEAAPEEGDVDDTRVELEIDLNVAFNPTTAGSVVIDRDYKTDETGAFEFRGVPVDSKLQLSVRPDVYAAYKQAGIELASGQHLVLDVPLARGGTIRGRVIDSEGSPLEEAEVRARHMGLSGLIAGELRETETDADGNFELGAVAPGEIMIETQADGFMNASLQLEQELLEQQVIDDVELVLNRGATIAGVVRFPDGRPAVEAEVEVETDWSKTAPMTGMGGGAGGEDETDEDGRFVVSGLTAGTYVVRAEAEVEIDGEERTWVARAGGVRPDGEDVVLELAAPVLITGRVVDTEGIGLEAFQVTATLQGSAQMLGIGAEQVGDSFETDPELPPERAGEFVLEDLRPGTWDVVANAENYASSEPFAVELPRPEGSEPLLFALVPAARVSGLVLDTSGNPVAGASVGLELDMMEMISAQMAGAVAQTVSDEEGRFLMDDLDPGTMSLIASYDGYAKSAAVPVELTSGEEVSDVVLELRVGGTIYGEVYGPDGDLAGGQMILLRHMSPFDQSFFTTEPDGTFRVENVAPGSLQIISMPGMIEAGIASQNDPEGSDFGDMFKDLSMEMLELEDGEERFVVLGAPPADPVKVRGRVTHDNEGIEGAMISFVPEGAEGLSGMKFDSTNEDGEFEIDLDAPGAHLLTVQTDMNPMGEQNSVEYLETIPEGRSEYDLDIELPGGRISGKVEGPDGKPLVGCRISLTVDGGIAFGTFLGGQYSELTTDAEGRYDIKYLRSGSYLVYAGGVPMGGMFGGESDGGRQVRDGIQLADGEWLQNVDFRLREPGTLEGKVVDAAGKPVPAASIFVRDENGRLVENFALHTTDGAGEFRYQGLDPGRYTASARTKDLSSPESNPVKVGDGSEEKVQLRLEPGTILVVAVVDKSGKELRASISVTDSDGHEVSSMMAWADLMENLGGNFSPTEHRLGPLPPGRYKVDARTEDGRSGSKPVTLNGQPERKIKLRIR